MDELLAEIDRRRAVRKEIESMISDIDKRGKEIEKELWGVYLDQLKSELFDLPGFKWRIVIPKLVAPDELAVDDFTEPYLEWMEQVAKHQVDNAKFAAVKVALLAHIVIDWTVVHAKVYLKLQEYLANSEEYARQLDRSAADFTRYIDALIALQVIKENCKKEIPPKQPPPKLLGSVNRSVGPGF